MKKSLLIPLVLGIAQTSGAVETTFQPNNTLAHITNSSSSKNYGSVKYIYSSNNGSYVAGNNDISKAIDSLSARAKQNEYQLSNQIKKLSHENITTPSLDEMKKWAEQGSVEYQLRLGMIYYEGKDVRQNLVASRKMFQKAANQGDIYGQGMLGYFYERGLGGLRQNRATAKELYGKVCDKGNHTGCSEYRRLNESGY